MSSQTKKASIKNRYNMSKLTQKCHELHLLPHVDPNILSYIGTSNGLQKTLASSRYHSWIYLLSGWDLILGGHKLEANPFHMEPLATDQCRQQHKVEYHCSSDLAWTQKVFIRFVDYSSLFLLTFR
jgi:hypothetical protein